MSLTASVLAFASQRFPKLSSHYLASSGYTLNLAKLGGPEAFTVWQKSTAERQDRAWQPIVAAAKAGHPREDVAALYGAIDSLPTPPTNLLEVGCGGGYNSELIMAHCPQIDYEGVDISGAMIDVAKVHYPNRDFAVGSAYNLEFADNSFDVVMDGVALLHMPGWRQAIPEYARVARSNVILHGLTLTESAPTTEFAKYAYGQPALEFTFNRTELTEECNAAGLRLVSKQGGLDYDLKRYIGLPSVSETWILSVG